MKSLTHTITLMGIFLTVGCATQTGWTPTVDTYNDANAFRLNQDMAECKQLAAQAAGGTMRESAMGAATGGLLGGAGGAALGALTGNAGVGAAIGAAAGGLGGGASEGLGAEARYKNAYNNCLSGRGHRVIR